MPITWTIDHDQRLLTAVRRGDVTLRDLEEHLDAVVLAGSIPAGAAWRWLEAQK